MAYQTLGAFRLTHGKMPGSVPRLETSLRDDFNHHDPTAPDMRARVRQVSAGCPLGAAR